MSISVENGDFMENTLTKILKIVFLVFSGIVFLVFLMLEVTHRDSFSPLNATVTAVNKDLYRILEDGSKVPVTCQNDEYIYVDAQAGEKVTISTVLPEFDRTDMCISVFGMEQDIGIYIDGAQRAYYSDKGYRLAGSYSASRFVIVPLCPEDSGKELRVTYQTTVSQYAGTLACPRFSSQQDILYWIYFRYSGQIACAILLLAVGIVFIIFGLVLKHNRRDNRGLCYLGMFSIIMAVWLLCQSNMRVFYSSYLSAVNLMTFITVIAAPIPLVMFVNILMKYHYQRIFNILIMIDFIYLLINIVVEFTNIADMIDLLPVTYFTIVVICGICLVTFFRYMKKGDIAAPRVVLIGLAGFFIVILAEALNLVFFNVFFVGKYLGYGLLFFLLNLGYAAFRSTEMQEKQYQEALRASSEKSTFLANMSHEIRTPINTILGMDEMILRENTNHEIDRYAEYIRNAGNVLLSLVNDVLDFTKIESGKMEIRPVRYELSNLLNDLIQAVETRTEQKGLSFTMDIEENIPNVLFGDELRIKQAITNLLSNAEKYTSEGGISLKVQFIRLSEKEVRLYISVTDTGIGIRKEDQERLYDSFVRLEETRNRSIEGTGLGLTITRHIIEQMNGRIDLDSEYGQGSTFTISFVQKIVEDKPIGCVEGWCRNYAFGKKQYVEQYDAEDVRMLVVDDNEMNLEVVKGLLKRTRAFIDTAGSGRECLEKVKSQSYDLIFLDHMMPEMNGVETLHQLQELAPAGRKKIPVIALTANAVSGAREDYLRYGFADYIAKPVEYRKLIEVLQKFLPDKIKRQPLVDNTQVECAEFLENNGIHIEEALKYTAGDFEQYLHLLELFAQDKARNKQELLREAYEREEWDNYVTYVHGLKNNARMIGADELADMAYEHECKGKEQDTVYIQKSFHSLIEKWNETVNIIHEYLNMTISLQRLSKEDMKVRPVLQEGEWETKLERIIEYLDTFRKKEALALLENLYGYELGEKKKQIVEQAIEAVRGYDYERAIAILGQ